MKDNEDGKAPDAGKEKDAGQDYSDIARDRPPLDVNEFEQFAHKRTPPSGSSVGAKILRGVGIAIGVAVGIVLLIFGACFIAFNG